MNGFYILGPCSTLFARGNKVYLIRPLSADEKIKLEEYKALVAKGADIIIRDNQAVKLASKMDTLSRLNT